MRALMAAMGDPQATYSTIHVTGTNGKGSTSRLATLLLQAQGLSVGTYSSPHLERVNERIALNGEPISDEALIELLCSLEQLERFLLRRGVENGGLAEPPTWFELLTAGALRHFGDEAVEAAVVEVGLGGLLDATNVLDAAVAVVTNVELDHVEVLGGTKASIAREKSGIVKAGSVVVVGEQDPDLVEIIAARGREVGAEALWRRDVDFACTANTLAHGGRFVDLRTPQASYEGLFLPLHGAHQGDNAATALAAVEAFFGAPLAEEVVAEAFANASVPGRLEVVARHPLVVLDGAHNPAGAASLGIALAEDFAAIERVVLVMGCLRGRDPAELLDAIGTERCSLVVATTPPSPRAQPATAVAGAARQLGVEARVSDSLEEALEQARQAAGPEGLVVVTGSLYVVGAARRLLRSA
jgi:dihydrofolate synthase/folylpolyglutamate synthase